VLEFLPEAESEIWMDAIQASLRMAEEPPQLDVRTTEIIAGHFGLEREMEIALDRLVAQPRDLDRFGFGHKVAVLTALLGSLIMDRVAAQLLAFNELRNAAAHPRTLDLKPLVQKLHNLLEKDAEFLLEDDEIPKGKPILLLPPEESSILAYAAGIAGALQAVVGTEILARAAISGKSKSSSKQRKVPRRKM
jgi:hypothetical protein